MASPVLLSPLFRGYIVQTYKSGRWQEYTSFATLNLAEQTAQGLAAKNPEIQKVRILNRITGQLVRVYEAKKSS
ncbi:MAG: hypothetical protein KDJ65_00630 [Anaerolineae bacterium]|nr:hypothetical protein [Anaerolineae bacterium]